MAEIALTARTMPKVDQYVYLQDMAQVGMNAGIDGNNFDAQYAGKWWKVRAVEGTYFYLKDAPLGWDHPFTKDQVAVLMDKPPGA
jgi:hypothetical protein